MIFKVMFTPDGIRLAMPWLTDMSARDNKPESRESIYNRAKIEYLFIYQKEVAGNGDDDDAFQKIITELGRMDGILADPGASQIYQMIKTTERDTIDALVDLDELEMQYAKGNGYEGAIFALDNIAEVFDRANKDKIAKKVLRYRRDYKERIEDEDYY